MSYPKIILQRGKEFSLQRRHHWVFSGAIAKADPGLESGDLVTVFSAKEEFLGIGHFSQGSIMVRIISFEEREIDQTFWNDKIASAYELRKSLGLTDNKQTNVFRLVHGEGDLLPGLIVDFYNGTAVIQAHHIGMHRHIPEISAALQVVLGEKLKGVYDKSAETLPKNLGIASNEWVWGKAETDLVQEYGASYRIDWEKGQKTGFFIDQRENRKLVSTYAKGKKVLNTFCYSGGFSVLALNEGASEVHSVDISNKAIALTEQNVALNPGFTGKHESIVADVVKYIREIGDDFDLIVLDPPAFAKKSQSPTQCSPSLQATECGSDQENKTGRNHLYLFLQSSGRQNSLCAYHRSGGYGVRAKSKNPAQPLPTCRPPDQYFPSGNGVPKGLGAIY